jgi:hypothetical protein
MSFLDGRISRQQKIMMIVTTFAVVLAISIGLGVGLTHSTARYSSTNATTSTLPSPPPSNDNISTHVWQPAVGATWNLELLNALDTMPTDGFEVWDIDLFDNTLEVISALKEKGSKVICYFSAGTYENWRPDQSSFMPSDLGNPLDDWPGERWLNIASPDIRSIMEKRLNIAVSKGCNGVDPDNVDGYNNNNGLGLTQQDSIDYMEFLAGAARQRGLAIGLKNAGQIIESLIEKMQWSVNEQCVQYDECETFAPFIERGKPVFHVEYPKGDDVNNDKDVPADVKNKICDAPSAARFSTIIKNIDLDSWIQTC